MFVHRAPIHLRQARNPHPLFDTEYYLARYPDVAASGVEPLTHFVAKGGQEGRKPHPLFDTSYYLSQHPDIAKSGINPLVHFLRFGANEGRRPNPYFDPAFYVRHNPGVRDAGINPLVDFLERGAAEGRDPSAEFNIKNYLDAHPEVANSGLNPLIHFIEFGAVDARSPAPKFDLRSVVAQVERVTESESRSNRHAGADENASRESASPLQSTAAPIPQPDAIAHEIKAEFDSSFYLTKHPLRLAPSQDPLAHYLSVGWKLGYNPNDWFDTDFYVKDNAELANSDIPPFHHFLTVGRAQARLPSDPALFSNAAAARIVRGRGVRNAKEILVRLRQETTLVDRARNFFRPENDLGRLYHRLLRKYKLFDDAFYRSTYLANASNDIDPIDHYIGCGIAAGFRPNPVFDPVEYLRLNQDVTAFGIDPIIHYAIWGWKEQREVGTHFDGNAYLAAYADVRKANFSPLHHYLAFGRAEGRAPVAPKTGATRSDPRSARVGGCPFGRRNAGTILCVTHDTQVGGAQQVIKTFAAWILAHTKYDIRFVAMAGGPLAQSFEDIAPLLNIGGYAKGLPSDDVKDHLRKFAGSDVVCIFVNSVASGTFFDWWDQATPAVAYIHEMPKIIRLFGDNIDKIRQRANLILTGSAAVREALCSTFAVPAERCQVVYDFIEDIAEGHVASPTARDDAKRKFGLAPSDFVVMACGVVHWRKSPEKFVEIAERVVNAAADGFRFVWIGNGEDLENCQRLVRKKNLERAVEFVGYQSNVSEWLQAADVFLLPSEEDPFPLVCLYAAAAGVPVVCFEKAGGMPEFVGRGCGVAVPFQDVAAMAEAVLTYRGNPELRSRHGEAGRKIVSSDFTIRTCGPRILDAVRQAAGRPPHVSIIVPNYNCGPFLQERLDSVYRQTFQDFEVILLDDASGDGSGAMLADRAMRQAATRFVANGSNSGSPFVQWFKGIELARGKLVWIAEADDACKATLLEALLPQFDDRNVFLGYVNSVPIDSAGNVLGDYNDLYLHRIHDRRWRSSYRDTDHREVNAALGIANSIPNASAVVFRPFAAEAEFIEAITAMRMCGDWYFYLRALKGGSIAYVSDALNFHRRHSGTVTARVEGSMRYFDELALIRGYVSRNYDISNPAREAAARFIEEDLKRFKIDDSSQQSAIRQSVSYVKNVKQRPSLLVVTSDLSPGGGQMFAIRLANAWMRAGGRAFLLNARHFPDHPKVVAKIDSRVALAHADEPGFSFGDFLVDNDIDVVQSSLWWADKLVHANMAALPARVPWTITMHGCYETLIEHPKLDASFRGRFPEMLERVDQWIFTAEKNKLVFDRLGYPRRLMQVFNGYEPERVAPRDRAALGLRPDSLVVCLASRAIEEKGWAEALAMAARLNEEGYALDLMLIGEGPAADRIRAGKVPPFVRLYGQVDDLQNYIAACDIGVVPSYFIGESMPLVLIEFLAQGKPVVATDIGNIRAMMVSGDQVAGALIPLRQGRVEVNDLVSAIKTLVDRAQRDAAGKAAREIFAARFTMEAMLDKYTELYNELAIMRSRPPLH